MIRRPPRPTPPDTLVPPRRCSELAAACGHLDHGFDDGARCCFSQPLTVSCHRMLFAGLSTQWFSSGKYRNLDSMPLRCSAVHALMPCATVMRSSDCPLLPSLRTPPSFTAFLVFQFPLPSVLPYLLPSFS